MVKNENISKTINIESAKKDNKRYTIFNYLKNNTTMLISIVSAMLVIVTSFAKLSTLISARNELVFWGFDPSYATFSEEPTIYMSVLSIVSTFIASATYIFFSYIDDAYISRKKRYILEKFILRDRKSEIKRINKKSKRTRLTEEECTFIKNC